MRCSGSVSTSGGEARVLDLKLATRPWAGKNKPNRWHPARFDPNPSIRYHFAFYESPDRHCPDHYHYLATTRVGLSFFVNVKINALPDDGRVFSFFRPGQIR